MSNKHANRCKNEDKTNLKQKIINNWRYEENEQMGNRLKTSMNDMLSYMDKYRKNSIKHKHEYDMIWDMYANEV